MWSQRVHPNSCGGPGQCWRCDYTLDERNSVEPEPTFTVHFCNSYEHWSTRWQCPKANGVVCEMTDDPAKVTCPVCIEKLAEQGAVA